ncbi:hypothetical protein ACH9L7_08670 [Haloferax sp. S1W]|uniref:DUF7322 domain-containing protein n=1 Tax=Haloferax sp. S1W TaxID=3377110 RepID=UPI0037CCBB44
MTDDERRDDVRESVESSSTGNRSTNSSEDDGPSRTDPVSRWGDPEARWGDPEKDLPNIPRVDIPGEDAGTDGAPEFKADVDPEQARMFWASVILANVGLAGISLGPMLIYFRGQMLVGGGVTLLGVVALARMYTMYREYQSRDWSSDDEAEREEAEAANHTDEADRADERNR